MILNHLRNSALRDIKRGITLAKDRFCTREISTKAIKWEDRTVYRTKPEVRKTAITSIVKYSTVSGLDAGGLARFVVKGGFHKGSRMSEGQATRDISQSFNQDKKMARDTWTRLTGIGYDKNKKQLYWYRVYDDTFWNQIHIPQAYDPDHCPDTREVWDKGYAYVEVTEEQFIKGERPKLVQEKTDKHIVEDAHNPS